jgi:3-oxoacyl-[acyl-carrier-protein] synthase III
MSSGHAFVRGASYLLGENDRDYTAIGTTSELADRFAMAPDPRLWGWGAIRTTDRELEELAVETGAATLRAAGLGAAMVDALVLCSNRIPGPAEGHGAFVASVLSGIGLSSIPCYGLILNRCVNLLAGLDVARALVTSGRHRRVLVISTDRVAGDAPRMSQFALFSDGAASCVVAADAGRAHAGSGDATGTGSGASAGVFELVGCATAQDTATLDWANEISSDLARQVNDQLLGPAGLKVGDLAALLHANLFQPLVVMKERQAGFSAEQLYLGNIPRIGHCFAADPLINLVDRAALGHLAAGTYCLLAASVPGSRIGALLRRVR